MAEIYLKNVTKKFDDVIVVKNFNLKIKDEEFLVLLGPSGCGKTTILRCIAGLEKITEGEIYIGKRIVNKVYPKDRDIAMVFQNYALYPHMSVYKNMAFGLKLHKIPKKEIKERVKKAAGLLGIGKLLKRKPRALSGGQRQRVALGRAIVRNPKVFLFDEPLSNLDAKLRTSMRAELLDLHHRLKTTTIYVTHDQLEAMTMGDRIVVMKDGVIQQIGIPQEVYNNPINAYVAGFIGSPSMNFIPCRIIKKNSNYYVEDDDGGFTLLIPPDNVEKINNYLEKQVTLGLRPEHFTPKKMMRNYNPQTVLKSSVWVAELVGSEILAHLKNGKHNFIARLDPSLILKRGDTFNLVVNMNKSHLFDKDSGKTIF